LPPRKGHFPKTASFSERTSGRRLRLGFAEVKDGKIALWQVFADNEAIRVIMRKYQ
jgi:limonene-1,2-epoxide hydrolase